MRRWPPWIAALAVALALARPSAAHEIRPCLLALRALGAGRYEVLWKAPPGASALAPRFPARCRRSDEVRADDLAARWTLDCGPAGLAGETIAVEGLDAADTDAVVQLAGEGAELTAVLRRGAPSLVIPAAAPGAAGLARTWFTLGIEHILRGADHLLFVLGLLMLVRRTAGPSVRARALEAARTVTAFTVAHSVTFALAALGIVRLPPAPVEATIALTIFLLAVELARPEARAGGRPWALAFACGLLHGLGFAGALGRIGLPAGQVPLALLLFNVGVEAGQLAFVLAAAACLHVAGRALARAPRWTALAPAYVLGSLAAFWCFERVAAFWA